MKASPTFLVLGLTLLTGSAYAQAIISAPIAEKISRKQTSHQTITSIQMAAAKRLAGQMKDVSGDIKGIVDQTRKLHEQWYSSLLQISSGVRNYRRVREIYDAQASMIKQFSTVQPDLARRGLTSVQLTEAGKTYKALLAENVGLIEEIARVLTEGRAKMTDPERLEFVNKIADQMTDQQSLMSYFTSRCQAIAQQQRQSTVDAQALQALIGGK
jgi:hypothetical protein